jgi:hypothetical protein
MFLVPEYFPTLAITKPNNRAIYLLQKPIRDAMSPFFVVSRTVPQKVPPVCNWNYVDVRNIEPVSVSKDISEDVTLPTVSAVSPVSRY